MLITCWKKNKYECIYRVQVVPEEVLLKSCRDQNCAALDYLVLEPNIERGETSTTLIKSTLFNHQVILVTTAIKSDLCKSLALCRTDSKYAKQKAL